MFVHFGTCTTFLVQYAEWYSVLYRVSISYNRVVHLANCTRNVVHIVKCTIPDVVPAWRFLDKTFESTENTPCPP